MKISFQGAHGAYSEMACHAVYPDADTLPCQTFETAFASVSDGKCDLAMIPVDNTLAGRVADVHYLLRHAELSIIGEYFQPIRHALLAIKETDIHCLKEVHSHIHALPQCRKIIKELGLKEVIHADTAGAAQEIATRKDTSICAIASPLAAKIYDLEILRSDIQDADHNTTRFLILSRAPQTPEKNADIVMTSFVFEVRNIPAALYKALGGFATNGINMTKLESYVDKNFQAAQFYCDVEGHPDDPALIRALEELNFYAKDVLLLGSYLAHPFRKSKDI